jgi:hypothetical protein
MQELVHYAAVLRWVGSEVALVAQNLGAAAEVHDGDGVEQVACLDSSAMMEVVQEQCVGHKIVVVEV